MIPSEGTGLVCDQGEPELLLLFAPPYAALTSRREAGQHFYCRDAKPRNNRSRKLRQRGVSGEARGARGYLRFWGDGPVELAFALQHNLDDCCLFPADAILAKPANYRPPAEPGPPYTRRIEQPPVDLSTVRTGARNSTLFDPVRFWAYGEPKPADMTAWDDAVRIHAGTRNLELRSPLRAPEVNRLAMSISWVWNGRGWTQEQRSRGGQTWGRMRRFDRLPLDSAIVKAVAAGYSMRVARVWGLSAMQVSRIVWRDDG